MPVMLFGFLLIVYLNFSNVIHLFIIESFISCRVWSHWLLIVIHRFFSYYKFSLISPLTNALLDWLLAGNDVVPSIPNNWPFWRSTVQSRASSSETARPKTVAASSRSAMSYQHTKGLSQLNFNKKRKKNTKKKAFYNSNSNNNKTKTKKNQIK